MRILSINLSIFVILIICQAVTAPDLSIDYKWSISSSYISSKIDYTVEILDSDFFGKTKARIHWKWKKNMKEICFLEKTSHQSESVINYLSPKYTLETYLEDDIKYTRKIYLFARKPDKKLATDLIYFADKGFPIKNYDKTHFKPSADSGYFDVNIPIYSEDFVIFIGFDTTTITLSKQTEGQYTNDNIPDFTFTLSGNETQYSCELWINISEHGINESTQNNTLTNITTNVTLADGGYEWYINCTNGTVTHQSSTRTLIIETILPRLQFYPPTSENNSDITVNHTKINLTIIESNLDTFIFSWNGTNTTMRNYTCTENMSFINDGSGGYCIDKYEASLWNADGTWNSTSATDAWRTTNTTTALADGAYAGSAPGVYPWVYISQTQARTACINAGKYLCTSDQWLGAANIKGQIYNLPSTITNCNVVSGSPAECQNSGPNGADACNTSYMPDCISNEGVYDMIGNVHEWCNESFTVSIPLANNSWHYINTTTMEWSLSSTADGGMYGKDGCYFGTAGTRAVFRGGSWGNGAGAGPFCADLDGAPSASGSSIGVRCCSAPN